jgi:hypothetical protein
VVALTSEQIWQAESRNRAEAGGKKKKERALGVVHSSCSRKRQWLKGVRRRRWPWAAKWQWQALSKRRRSDRATDGQVPCGFFLFQLIKNWLKIVKLKWMPYLAAKIPNLCMMPYWKILNNFLNCGDLKFLTEYEIKFMERIQYLKILWILKGDQTFWKNMINPPKFSRDFIFTKVNLVGTLVCKKIEFRTRAKRAWFE